ncbi:MAG: PhoH family protein [Nitrospinae bacterium]|nr:PhoH family protein [Nitrospinota bacterium]
MLEKGFGVRITTVMDKNLNIEGKKEDVLKVERLIEELHLFLSSGFSLKNGDLRFIVRLFLEDGKVDIKSIFSERIQVSPERPYISPKSLTQREYIFAIKKYDIVLGIGPAGTGKTYLAMGLAVSGLLKKRYSRIILVRPAVEAGEKLGYLPGDMHDKINPYLRPLYDALYDMVEFERAGEFVEKGLIEIAPLAYMRGRTLNDSFIILDEAQNTTSDQMKMFLTRIGFNSKVVITGDITQVDLPYKKSSGLIQVQKILKKVEGIKFIYFSERDVVRHELVQQIIKAYERYNSKIKIKDSA